MPVPFHVALRHDLRPHQPDSERALLEQRARVALADERRPRQHDGGAGRRRSKREGITNLAPLRAACATVLLVVAFCAIASKASAMPGSWPQLSPRVAAARSSGGGPMATLGIVRASAIQPNQTSIRPSETFDWADASVGAGFAVTLGLLLAGAALLLNRRWVHGQLPAGSRR